jgi:tetratricopeptide (TPR) repeat protein
MRFGEHLRRWRKRRDMSLLALADMIHFDKGYLSRVEQGKRHPRQVLAEVADEALGAGGQLITAWIDDYGEGRNLRGGSGGVEATKRRTFVTSAAMAAGSGLLGGLGEPEQRMVVAALRDALVPEATPEVAWPGSVVFSRAVTRARRDFTAARYGELADELARLLPVARVATDQAALTLAAQVYHLSARTLIKFGEIPLSWVAADRAEHSAQASGDVEVIGQARRDLVSLFHRSGDYRKARDIAARTADQLQPRLVDASSAAFGSYGALMSTGAIAAARLEDRASALEMLDEARRVAHRAPRLTFSLGHVVTYQIGVSIILGDAGTAIEYAKSIDPAKIPTVERRASYFTGIAEAYTLWGKSDRAVRALLTAEKIAPDEISRSGPRAVITELLHRDPHSSLSGLRGLARRSGVRT